MIAALFVEARGCYAGLEGVDVWDVTRDARLYDGPHPVVAHPPCERWGRYWHGGPSAKVRRVKGDDGGCFASALNSVRTWGGVIEHPAASAAWRAFGLNHPPFTGGWVSADFDGGWTCWVDQRHYGHRARKPTWLYACGPRPLPLLVWGPGEPGIRIDAGFHSAAERAHARATMTPDEFRARSGRMGKRERTATPLGFRDLLLAMARSVPQREAA